MKQSRERVCLKSAALCVLFVTTVVRVAVGEEIPVVDGLLRGAYPELTLLSYAKGDFTRSGSDEYLAFYEDPSYRYESDSPQVIVGKVLLVKDGRIKRKYDLEGRGLITNAYPARLLAVITNPELHFGRWASYAFVGDFNENGVDEILFFELSGTSFLPVVLEFDGKDFVTVLDFKTPKNILSEIRTEVRDGQKFIRIYGYGTDASKGQRDWYLYQWSSKSSRYEIVQRGAE